jgi:hypothetical protein
VWKGVFGKDYYAGAYTRVATSSTSSDIYGFLSSNNAKPGDILWCHSLDKNQYGNYKVTHNMLILGYDSSGVWLSDGTSTGKLWHNNTKITYDNAGYQKYFSGNCVLVLYKVSDTLWNAVSSTSITPSQTSHSSTLSRGSSGSDVRDLQIELNKVANAGLAVDGSYGS